MEKVDETAAFLAGLTHGERLSWLKEHQYSRPISFEREIDGTIYTGNAHFSEDAEAPESKVKRIHGISGSIQNQEGICQGGFHPKDERPR